MAADSTVRVSVIVPVYNPGRYLEPLIRSLAAQTLPQHEFETIFVDDGSTDETPSRLDRLADEHDNVTVLHGPNSGWPGRPRNLGIARARGRYVFFADQDDWFGLEALQRMTDYADAHGSDILIGRYAGHRRSVAKHLFVGSLARATLVDTPLMDSLTPHKMFRRSFLDEHGLRFPEGRRRLEDHVFVTAAYFLATTVSILADYHCYFHIRRDDDGNAAFQRIDPVGYYANVREVVDVVLAHTQPGPLRDDALRRSLRSEVLGRLDGRTFLDQDADYRRLLFDQARAVAVEAMPLGVDDGLPAALRVRARLLRAGRLDALAAYVEQELQLGVDLQLLELAWADDGTLTLEAEGLLVNRADGKPWAYRRDGDRLVMVPPAAQGGELGDTTDCTDAPQSGELELVLRHREDSEEWLVPATTHVTVREQDGRAWLVYRLSARIDPLTLGAGGPLSDGIWDVYGKISQTGWVREARVGAHRSPQATSGARSALLAGRLVTPYWTDPHGNLSVDVAAQPTRLIRAVRTGSQPLRLVPEPQAATTIVRVTVPMFTPPDAPGVRARLRLRNGPGRPLVDLDAHSLRDGAAAVQVCARLPRLRPGHWRVSVSLDVPGWGGFRDTGAAIEVPRLRRAAVAVRDGDGSGTARSPSRLRRAYHRARRRLGTSSS